MVIDLAKEIPQENEFMYDIVHYTDKGAGKIADIISGRLKPVVNTRIKQHCRAGALGRCYNLPGHIMQSLLRLPPK